MLSQENHNSLETRRPPELQSKNLSQKQNQPNKKVVEELFFLFLSLSVVGLPTLLSLPVPRLSVLSFPGDSLGSESTVLASHACKELVRSEKPWITEQQKWIICTLFYHRHVQCTLLCLCRVLVGLSPKSWEDRPQGPGRTVPKDLVGLFLLGLWTVNSLPRLQRT